MQNETATTSKAITKGSTIRLLTDGKPVKITFPSTLKNYIPSKALYQNNTCRLFHRVNRQDITQKKQTNIKQTNIKLISIILCNGTF